MPIGDVKSGLSSIAAGGNLDIQPPAGEEWVIHNIYHEFDVDLKFTNGINILTFDTSIGAGVYARFSFHVTNSHYLIVTNRHTTAARLIGYDGVVTRSA